MNILLDFVRSGVSSISKVVSALSALFEAKRLRTRSFHPQTNEIV
jgi:hypothetical protein